MTTRDPAGKSSSGFKTRKNPQKHSLPEHHPISAIPRLAEGLETQAPNGNVGAAREPAAYPLAGRALVEVADRQRQRGAQLGGAGGVTSRPIEHLGCIEIEARPRFRHRPQEQTQSLRIRPPQAGRWAAPQAFDLNEQTREKVALGLGRAGLALEEVLEAALV